LLAALLLLPAQRVLAWGDLGHEVVADVASHYLTEPARTRVNQLLAGDNSGLVAQDIADEATWADHYRDSQRRAPPPTRYDQTHNWHFVNIELGSDAAASLAAACHNFPAPSKDQPASSSRTDDCVVTKVMQFAAELKSPATPPPERLLALQFLLHLVGDLHQPLHDADAADEGGNQKTARGPGLRSGSLHHHWDTSFVNLLGSDPQQIADALVAQINPDDLRQWQKGGPRDWALESFQLAARDAYHLPEPASGRKYPVYVLDQAYIDTASADVRLQLSRAGVRLAALLNAALAP
jgi:hypothetical protein